jgi:ABC-type dipeptide/oligopeptide/nickel transport system permease component
VNRRYVLRRLVHGILILWLVTVTVFMMIHIVPGDPARMMLGDRAREHDVEELRTKLGLDRPLPEQYIVFASGIVVGDFGESIRAQRPVSELVSTALPATLLLLGSSLLLAFTVGIPLGVLAGVHRGGIADKLALVLSLIGQSVAPFWLGLMLISFFSVKLGILPTSGIGGFRHLVLPVLALAPTAMGMVLRVTRVSVIEVMNENYIRTAVSKGMHPITVVWKHCMKNASIPIVTVVGLQIGSLLGGAIVTETVFAWPGIGRLAVNSLIQRDWPVVRTVVLLSAITLVIMNFLIDMTYAAIDKRVKF